ncbi:MAG: hypothetical protein IJD00_06370, partial [Clostridia bacterium]|nr:hypothetical protein [Clostridia bacterium]
MKKTISVALATFLVLSAVMTVPVVFANTTANDIITNTFDDGWKTSEGSNLALETPDGANGNALQFNYITSYINTTGNNIRHYKIYNPVKVGDGFVDYQPAANTTYKLTFRYRTRSLTDYNIYINVRGVKNDTVGDVLCRVATIKKSLKLGSTNVWDTAVAYFTTPEEALEALAVTAEWGGANDSTTNNFQIVIDDLKLEKAPSNFVLINTFEEDDVTVDTINLGTDTQTYKVDGYNANETGYNTSTITTSKNSYTLRANSTIGFRASREPTSDKKAHFEIYDYSKGIGTDGKLQSFVPKKGSTYTITFDYKIARSNSHTLMINIRPVTVDGENRILGDVIVAAVTIPKGDTNHPTPAIWKTATVDVPIEQAVDGLAVAVEASTTVGTYTFIDNVVVTEVKDECEHENTTKTDANVVGATYFVDGSKDIVCECGETVQTGVVIPATADALSSCEEEFANGNLTITLTYSEDLYKDIDNGAKIYFNYSIDGYNPEPIPILDGYGAEITLEGFNASRLNAELTYYLTAVYDGVDTTKLAEDTTRKLTVANDVELDSKTSAFVNALNADGANTVVSTKIDATTHFAENTITA